MVVREFPPRLSFNKNVSTLSLYGTLPPPPSLPPSLLEPALEEEDPPDFVDNRGEVAGDPVGDGNGDGDGDTEGEEEGLRRLPPRLPLRPSTRWPASPPEEIRL